MISYISLLVKFSMLSFINRIGLLNSDISICWSISLLISTPVSVILSTNESTCFNNFPVPQPTSKNFFAEVTYFLIIGIIILSFPSMLPIYLDFCSHDSAILPENTDSTSELLNDISLLLL